MTPGGVVTKLAGVAGGWGGAGGGGETTGVGVGVPGGADGTGNKARFGLPNGVAVDNTGNVFVADSANNTIRKITSTGVVTTLAGRAGFFGGIDGTGINARFNFPQSVAVDTAGN